MEKGFRSWLQSQGFDRNTVSTQLSHVARLERHFGDLDAAFDADGFERLRTTLAYTKEDERNRRPNPAPFAIDGNLYSNLAGYRTTLNYYSDFRHSAEAAESSKETVDTAKAATAKRGSASFVPWTDERVERLKELWSQGITATQIAEELGGVSRNAVIAKVHRLGLNPRPLPVGSQNGSEDGAVRDAMGRPLFIDARELYTMREAFLARFPDFEALGFDASEGLYWDVERGYKQKLIRAAADAISARLRDDPGYVGTALLRVITSKASNLLDWREQRRLSEVGRRAPGLVERAIGEMVLAPSPPAEVVGRCIEQIAPAYLEGREERPFADLRTLPTTALALAKPAEAIAVRFTAIQRAAIRLTGRSLFHNAPMTPDEYQAVLDIAHHIERVMRNDWGWRPRDLWDVQGFLWVATEVAIETDKKSVSIDGHADQSPDEPAVQDRYRTQADDPAMVDALERGPFAAVLAARIVEIRNSERTDDPEGDRAFMVHLHGPWGSGKSSILNLLRQELEQPNEGHPSLVVTFNAWKQQRMRPPWWALMNAIYRRAMSGHLPWGERFNLWKTWWSWRWKAEMFPILLVAVIAAGLSIAVLGAETRSVVETAAKIGVVAAAALASVYAYSRVMIFGSQKAVQTYADLTTDPYRRIVELFNCIVTEIKPPLVVFIDDLDRCDSDYVVELLEGIQTLFRHAPVTYVVAADRKWICSSFEKKYGDFAGSIGEPCRPLGYLFLDKLFQISAEMPRLTREVQATYLARLLGEEPAGEAAITDEMMAKAEQKVIGITDEVELQQVIADEEAKPVPVGQKEESHNLQRALRRAAALQITSAAASAETEHRLQKLAHLLEPNPRSMKRLVNAVGMAQARGILEGRAASPETRARWAMLSLRWPLLADFIADHPAAVAQWKKPKGKARRAAASTEWPAAVRALQDDRTVMEVVGGEGEEGALTPDTLAQLLG
jgi:hypothetical protein